MAYWTLFLRLSLLLMVAAPAQAMSSESDLPAQLDHLAADLTAGYRAKRAKNTPAQPLAVLTFNSSSRLEKEHAGFAVAELLTQRLVGSSLFRVVERNELDRVLGEQRLQATAAIDPDTAVRVGKLAGARLLVLGSIEKLGRQYGINARLVDVENGEVLSAAYEQVAASDFERDAQPYLALVPERQAIGVYFLYDYRTNSNSFPSYQDSPFGVPITFSPQSFSLGLVGGGVRYFPIKSLMLDASLALLPGGVHIVSQNVQDFNDERTLRSRDLTLFRATVNWFGPESHGISPIVGAGLASYRIAPQNINFGTAVVPSFRLGMEYRPQQRVGIGVFFNYDLLNKTGTDLRVPSAEALRVSRWSIEPTAAVYF